MHLITLFNWKLYYKKLLLKIIIKTNNNNNNHYLHSDKGGKFCNVLLKNICTFIWQNLFEGGQKLKL